MLLTFGWSFEWLFPEIDFGQAVQYPSIGRYRYEDRLWSIRQAPKFLKSDFLLRRWWEYFFDSGRGYPLRDGNWLPQNLLPCQKFKAAFSAASFLPAIASLRRFVLHNQATN